MDNDLSEWHRFEASQVPIQDSRLFMLPFFELSIETILSILQEGSTGRFPWRFSSAGIAAGDCPKDGNVAT